VAQTDQVRTIGRLDELVEFCMSWKGHRPLFVRWTPDCRRDLATEGSVDELTGTPLPGLSANGLAVEPWWQDRPLEGWLARRLYDYRHLVELRGQGTRPWVLTGDEVGRGPDNEPLIGHCEVVAAIDSAVIEEAVALVDAMPADWGSLRRR
jgi:uncharacterized protein DUF6098